jgi:hypothetical protein
VRICDPFREARVWFMVAERHFRLTCTCGVPYTADELTKRLTDDGVTLYACPACGATLIGIAPDDRPAVAGAPATATPPDDEDGHRMCGFVFASTVDMTLWPADAAEEFVTMPARPLFFSSRGC